jgi:hypothetical protein
MKDFTRKRLDWIDRQFVVSPHVSASASSGKDTTLISLSAPLGKIYYTLDGSDPRSPGGGISPKAQLATGTLKVPQDAKLFARALYETRWSAPARR